MEPIEIKHAIERAGKTQTEIARTVGVTKATVNLVIWHGAVSAPVRQEISRVIGRPVEQIWPDYYMKRSVNQ